jgi:hypothetical protein
MAQHSNKISKSMKLGFAAMAALGAMAHANDAMALETRQCGTSESMRAALRAEGQVPLIVAYRSIPSRPKNYFSTNENLSLGYQFEEQNGEICIAAKYRDIRLNNDETVAIPAWARIAPANSAYNGFLNTQQTRDNARVIFGALALGKDANGRDVPTSKIVVTQGRDGQCGRIAGYQCVSNRGTTVAGYANGEYAIAMDVEDIAPNSNFSKLAEARTTTATTLLASNTPR